MINEFSVVKSLVLDWKLDPVDLGSVLFWDQCSSDWIFFVGGAWWFRNKGSLNFELWSSLASCGSKESSQIITGHKGLNVFRNTNPAEAFRHCFIDHYHRRLYPSSLHQIDPDLVSLWEAPQAASVQPLTTFKHESHLAVKTQVGLLMEFVPGFKKTAQRR